MSLPRTPPPPPASVSITYRAAVLRIVQASEQCQTGQAIAQATGLSYRQTVDALNALLNAGKIRRQGRKYTARWCRILPDPTERPTALLERILWTIARKTTS